MTEKSRYFQIGIFILVGIILFITGITIFGAGNLFKKEIMMETYFDGSVQGLDIGSPVKYRGVKIGEVKRISVVNQEYQLRDQSSEDFYKYGGYVMINVALDTDAMPYIEKGFEEDLDRLITEKGLRVKFAYLGITGLAYLEVDFVDPERNPPLAIAWEPKTLYIPSVPNTMQLITDRLNDLATSLDEDFFPMMQQLSKASEDFPEMTDQINETLFYINRTFKGEQYNVAEILNNIRVITEDLKVITTTLRKNPSQMLFGEAPPKLKIDRE